VHVSVAKYYLPNLHKYSLFLKLRFMFNCSICYLPFIVAL